MHKFLLPLFLAFAPAFAFAQTLTRVQTFITQLGDIIELLLPIAITVAVLYFFWGLAQFILASGDDSSKEEGRNKMIWGVLALFVIVSVWGIVGFLGELFGIGQGGSAPVPGVKDTEDSTGGIPLPGGGGGGGGGGDGGGTFPPPPPPAK